MRRGGLIENSCPSSNHCEFKPTPNMVAAYGEGKKTRHKVSIMKRSSNRQSGELSLSKKRSSFDRGQGKKRTKMATIPSQVER